MQLPETHRRRQGTSSSSSQQRKRRQDSGASSVGSDHSTHASTRSSRPEGTVCAPWYHQGVPRAVATLSRELHDFCTFMSLSQDERRAREDVVGTVTAVAQMQWPGATVHVYGSFAQGTSSPASAVDLAVNGVTEMAPAEEAFRPFGKIQSAVVTPGAAEGFLQFVTPTGITVNVHFQCAPECTALLAANEAVAGWIAEFPAAPAVLAAVRHVLSQACADCVDVCRGGITPYALLVMIVHVCRRCGASPEADEVLLKFLQYFGHDFTFGSHTISATSADALPRHPDHADDEVSIADPHDADNNLATGCSRLRQIRAYLQSCLIALRRWESEPDAKERTPLSMIISHQPLWARSQSKSTKGPRSSSSRQHSAAGSDDGVSQTSRGSRSSRRGYDSQRQQAHGQPGYVPVLYVPLPGPDGSATQYAPVAVLPQQGQTLAAVPTRAITPASAASPGSSVSGRCETLSASASESVQTPGHLQTASVDTVHSLSPLTLSQAAGLDMHNSGDAQSSHGSSEGHASSRGSRGQRSRDSPPLPYSAVVAFRFGRTGDYGLAEQIPVGTPVLVATGRGSCIGTISSLGGGWRSESMPANRGRGRVLRAATQEELIEYGKVAEEEAEALAYIREQVAEHKVPIVVHAAEYQFDRKKITFHYSSPVTRPPFQTLLHDMYRRLRCRIWMNNCQPRSGEPGELVDPSHYIEFAAPVQQKAPPLSPECAPQLEDVDIPPGLQTPPPSLPTDTPEDLPPPLACTIAVDAEQPEASI